MQLGGWYLVTTLLFTKSVRSFHINKSNPKFLPHMEHFNKTAKDSTEEVTASGIVLYRIFNNIPEFLLLRASYQPFHYTPPKGRLDEGETFLTAALRETQEEAGIEQDKYELDQNFAISLKYKVNEGRGKETIYFLAKLKDPNTPVVLSDEHSEYVWANETKVKEVCSHQTTIDCILKAKEHIKL